MRNPVHCWSPVDSKFNESNPTQFLVKSVFERLYNFADTLIFIANIIERTRCRCWLWVHQQWGRPHPSIQRTKSPLFSPFSDTWKWTNNNRSITLCPESSNCTPGHHQHHQLYMGTWGALLYTELVPKAASEGVSPRLNRPINGRCGHLVETSSALQLTMNPLI